MDTPSDWFWEGNVVEAIARALVEEGWEVISTADTSSRQRGIDIHATRNGRELLVEVKGYPSKGYRDPRRAGETKPTSPTLQAQHWYSHALLKVMRLQTKHPDAIIALGFPESDRYRDLFEETRSGLEKLGIAMLTVRENGSVERWNF